MTIKTLVVITLRLFTIYFLVESIAQSMEFTPLFMKFNAHEGGIPIYWYFVPALWTLFVAGLLWASAFRLSSQVAKGLNLELNAVSLTKEDLYRFAFVFLGIIFTLSAIYPSLNTGFNFFLLDFPQPVDGPFKGQYLAPFLGNMFTLSAGLLCVLGAKRWTTKLIRWENKHDNSTSSQAVSQSP